MKICDIFFLVPTFAILEFSMDSEYQLNVISIGIRQVLLVT